MGRENRLKLLVSKSCMELGEKVNRNLQLIRNDQVNRIVKMEEPVFGNGESKVVIKETVRDADLFYLTDPNNWGVTYKMYGKEMHMSPQDHMHNLDSTISAICGHADRLTVVEPLLYSSRQHRRKGRESLDCAISLQHLISLGVDCIITVDAHDREIQNAIPHNGFENLYPTYYILESFLANEDIDYRKMMAISPDSGAVERTIHYANVLGCKTGQFNKRRDYSKVVDGKNVVTSHEYIGPSVKGRNMFIVDDMIASGGSILDTARRLKNKGALKIYFVASFCLFTEGIEIFDKAYEEGVFDAIYTTNATYIPVEYKSRPYLKVVDISYYLAQVIHAINSGISISELLDGTDKKLVLAKKVADLKRQKR